MRRRRRRLGSVFLAWKGTIPLDCEGRSVAILDRIRVGFRSSQRRTLFGFGDAPQIEQEALSYRALRRP